MFAISRQAALERLEAAERRIGQLQEVLETVILSPPAIRNAQLELDHAYTARDHARLHLSLLGDSA